MKLQALLIEETMREQSCKLDGLRPHYWLKVFVKASS